MSKYKRLVIAHRGASGLVKFENTLESFEKAIEVNCDAIECDVRRTKDNVLIINHNDDIDNMLIKDYTYEYLNNYTTNKGYHLPTLLETLNLVKGRILIDIEVKEPGYEEQMSKEIYSVLSNDEFFIRSFSDEALIAFKKINKDIKVILLTGVSKPKPFLKTRFSEVYPKRRLKKCQAFAVSPYYKEMVWGYTKRVHKLGYKILPWTVNTTDEMKEIINDVDGIVTNYPDKLIEVINENVK